MISAVKEKAKPPSHIAFADEKGYNIGRYRGISLVSIESRHVDSCRKDLNRLLCESDVREFKWEKLGSARERFAAIKLLDFAIEKINNQIMRIDTLTWDTEDSRHKVIGRDDIANLQRMYYRLFKDVLCNKWPDGNTWLLCPDENTALEWNRVRDFLGYASSKTEIRRDLLTHGKFILRLKREFKIEDIKPCESHEEPLVQLADLCAGLAVYSRTSYDRYENWLAKNSDQGTLFRNEKASSIKLSKSDQERCLVLAEFNKKCKNKKLGVSLKRERGLKTFDHSKPINFWWYEPQHEDDKAPCKNRK